MGFFDTTYPDAVQILDVFHALERLSQFAIVQFKDKDIRQQWMLAQKTKLLEKGIDAIILSIKELVCKGQTLDIQQKTLTYLTNNKHRMLYKTYKDKGYLIESAHRHVIQQRLKLAGQRWTIQGIQQVANLRVAYKNGQNDKTLKLIKNAA